METECGLDDLKHDVVIDNSETDKGEHLIKKLCTDVIEPMLGQRNFPRCNMKHLFTQK